METLVGIVFIIVCFLLIIVVLLQKGRGGGLGAAFGGAGSSAFGTRTGDVFTWITIVLTAVFLLLAIATTVIYRPPTGTVLTPKLDPGPEPGQQTVEIPGEIEVVQITCRTRGARIAYTTDGSEPLEDKAKRSGMATAQVKAGQTLKVRAYRKKWTPSETVSVTYRKKVKQPATKEATSRPATAPATQPTGGEDKPAPGGGP